ncbi:L-proline dehydrogenase [Murinocardiopsis flavida]|uniref:proline dehydrogenase n=1 Tax=Murinocardiopsis flavida TaxID=645275 RepID=A0A2P8D6H5_9ACTN|nr:proline dehydrogenase family protein [Murinocardiopsis flavida]PSK92801.1 L-proline dehydrogenase [Murinocardiopsis flavida]
MVLRHALMTASESGRLRAFVSRTPAARGAVDRFVAGEHAEDAVRAVADLAAQGMLATIDHLGERTLHPLQAEDATRSYLVLLGRLADAGLAGSAEVSVKPTAVGLGLGAEGEALAADNIARIATAAERADTTVTVDMEDAGSVAAILRIYHQVRDDHPGLGCVLQSALRRTEGDLVAVARPGTRVRLCKGAYAPDPGTAHTRRHDVDTAYVRLLRWLMESQAYPMVATHDPRLIKIAGILAAVNGKGRTEFEYQMLYGVRPDEQWRLAQEGAQVRVYVPYGPDWYGYLTRRLAERPANVGFALRSLAGRK